MYPTLRPCPFHRSSSSFSPRPSAARSTRSLVAARWRHSRPSSGSGCSARRHQHGRAVTGRRRQHVGVSRRVDGRAPLARLVHNPEHRGRGIRRMAAPAHVSASLRGHRAVLHAWCDGALRRAAPAYTVAVARTGRVWKHRTVGHGVACTVRDGAGPRPAVPRSATYCNHHACRDGVADRARRREEFATRIALGAPILFVLKERFVNRGEPGFRRLVFARPLPAP